MIESSTPSIIMPVLNNLQGLRRCLVSPSIYRAVGICRRLDASPIDGIRMLILLVVYGLARFPLGKPL